MPADNRRYSPAREELRDTRRATVPAQCLTVASRTARQRRSTATCAARRSHPADHAYATLPVTTTRTRVSTALCAAIDSA
jgi:hypothetical protein